MTRLLTLDVVPTSLRGCGASQLQLAVPQAEESESSRRAARTVPPTDDDDDPLSGFRWIGGRS